jgi:hypothetical protein
MSGFIFSVSDALLAVLWVAVPVFFIALFWRLRLIHKRQEFLAKQKWDMLEVRIPREIVKRPKAMEQVFAAMYGIYSYGINWQKKYLDGTVDLWMSFEIAAKGGGIGFFIRVPNQWRNLVESSIYGQYPEAEVIETEDYTQELPSTLPDERFDLFGTAFKLAKDSPYPIKTYTAFDEFELDDLKRIDPLSAIFEAMSKLKGEERIWLQCIISPTGAATGYDIQKEGAELAKKIVEENTKVEGEEGKVTRKPLTHGMQEVIKGIENKISKHVFQVTIRYMYVAPKDQFNGQNNPAILGSLQQFNTQNMNSLSPDSSTMTIQGGWIARFFPKYKNRKILEKKRILYDSYVSRQFGRTNHISDTEKFPVLSSEELATIYHYPISTVKAPQLQRIHSRRAEPPVNLPVE